MSSDFCSFEAAIDTNIKEACLEDISYISYLYGVGLLWFLSKR